MAKYDFLVKKLAEAANSWAQYGTEEGSMYDCLKTLQNFYSTHTIEECTQEAEMQVWEQVEDKAAVDFIIEFMEEVEGCYEKPQVDRLKEMPLHQALILVLPDYLVA